MSGADVRAREDDERTKPEERVDRAERRDDDPSCGADGTVLVVIPTRDGGSGEQWHEHASENDLPGRDHDFISRDTGKGISASTEDRHGARIGEQRVEPFDERSAPSISAPDHVRLPSVPHPLINMDAGYRPVVAGTPDERGSRDYPSTDAVREKILVDGRQEKRYATAYVLYPLGQFTREESMMVTGWKSAATEENAAAVVSRDAGVEWEVEPGQ